MWWTTQRGTEGKEEWADETIAMFQLSGGQHLTGQWNMGCSDRLLHSTSILSPVCSTPPPFCGDSLDFSLRDTEDKCLWWWYSWQHRGPLCYLRCLLCGAQQFSVIYLSESEVEGLTEDLAAKIPEAFVGWIHPDQCFQQEANWLHHLGDDQVCRHRHIDLLI